MAEATVVEEPQVISPSDAGDATPDAAVPEVVAEEPVLSVEEALEAAKADYFKEDGKEKVEPAPEPWQPEVDPVAVQQAINSFREGYGSRQKRLDDLEDSLVEAGLQPAVAKLFIKSAKDTLNEHHADSLKYAGFEERAKAYQSSSMEMHSALDKVVPTTLRKELDTAIEESVKRNKGVAPFVDILATVLRLGGKTAEVVASKVDAYSAGYNKGRADGEKNAASASSGQKVNGTAASSSTDLTLDKAQSASVDELMRIRARQKAS